MVRESLLSNAALPSELLKGFASSQDRSVRTAVARNPSMPGDVLVQLAEDDSRSVRSAVAENPATPERPLRLLSRDAEKSVRWSVAGNANIARDIVELLANEPDDDVRREVARNPSTGPEALRLLARAPNDVVCAVASNPATPLDVLSDLAQEAIATGNSWLVTGLYENPSTSVQVLESLIHESDGSLLKPEEAARHPLTQPNALTQLAEHPDDEVREAVAANPRTPPASVDSLSRDKRSAVRRAVMRNPQVSPSALQILAQDDLWGIRALVALHPLTEPHVIEELRRSDVAAVRLAAHMNPSLLAASGAHENTILARGIIESATQSDRSLGNSDLGKLLELGVTDIPLLCKTFGQLAKDTATPPAVLEMLSWDEGEYTREETAGNTATPQDSLRRLAGDESASVRAGVGANKSTPLDVLGRLVADSDPAVRAACASNTEAVARWIQQLPGTVLNVAAQSPPRQTGSDASGLSGMDWMADLEGVLQQMWLSPTGDWLCVHSIADREGLLYVLDRRRGAALTTIHLLTETPDECALDVSWSPSENYVVVVEGQDSWPAVDEVHIHAFELPTARLVVRTGIRHPELKCICALGVSYSEDGEKFAVCVVDGDYGWEQRSVSVVVYELASGKSLDLLPWSESHYDPVLHSDLSCAYLITMSSPARQLLVSTASSSEVISFSQPGEYCGNVWLSDNERSLFIDVELEGGDGLTEVIEVDLEFGRPRSERIPLDAFVAPPQRFYSVPRVHDGSRTVAMADGTWSCTIDQASNTLVRSPLDDDAHEGKEVSGFAASSLGGSPRGQIPLELPNSD